MYSPISSPHAPQNTPGSSAAAEATDDIEHGSSSGYQRSKVPQAFICAITSEMMRDPVVTCDGQTYERAAIERWLEDHTTSPRTNARLDSKQLIPNVALRQQIDDFCKAHGLSPPRPYHPPPRRRSRRLPGVPGGHGDALLNDPCPTLPGWVVAALFLTIWMCAWLVGEVTVAQEVLSAVIKGELTFATFFTFIWLAAWTLGGCIACSAVYGLLCREAFGGDAEAAPIVNTAPLRPGDIRVRTYQPGVLGPIEPFDVPSASGFG